jgi:hypothetical protein
MATSNEYASEISALYAIDEAFERCLISGNLISGYQLESAKKAINAILDQWSNANYPSLYLVKKGLLQLIRGQTSYLLPSNCVDIIDKEVTVLKSLRKLGGTASSSSGSAGNAFSDDLTAFCTQTEPNGYIQYIYPQGVPILYVGIMSAVDADYKLLIRSKYQSGIGNILDPLNVALRTPETAYLANQTVWWAIPAAPSAQVWRIQETGGATLNINKIYFNINSPTQPSRPLARISRSSYAMINNKTQIGQVSQFQVDRNFPQSVINFYLNPDGTEDLVTYNYNAYTQEVVNFTQDIELPKRFWEALVSELAARMAEKFAPHLYEQKRSAADQAFALAKGQDVEHGVNLKIAPTLESQM